MNEQVNISWRASHYGDGLFETIAIRNSEPRLWDYHMERLREGCRRLGFAQPDAEQLRAGLDEELHASAEDTSCCVAKLVISAAPTGRGYGRAIPSVIQIWVGIFPAAPLDPGAYCDGVETMICETRLATGPLLAGIKTLNRLEQVLARSECAQSGAFEGLTLDADGRIICGTMSNVFIVRDNRVMTPSLERCGVAGIMRRLVIEELGLAGQPVEITDLDVDALVTADEVFLTNSQYGAVPVSRCDSSEWPVGPTTRAVMTMLAKRGIHECRQ